MVDKYLAEGFVPIYSLGYLPQYYPEPIVSDEGYDVVDARSGLVKLQSELEKGRG